MNLKKIRLSPFWLALLVACGVLVACLAPVGTKMTQQAKLKIDLKRKAGELEAAKGGTYHRELINDPERCEYFVPIQWLQTVPLERAVHEIGLFGNQNTVCKPTTPKWRSTVDRLKEKFPDFDRTASNKDLQPAAAGEIMSRRG